MTVAAAPARGLAHRGAGRAAWRAGVAAAAATAPWSRSARSAGARRSCWRSAAGSVVAIDPHAGSDRGPQEIAADATRGDADHAAFHANLRAAGVADRVRHVRKFSADAHGDVAGPCRCCTSTARTASGRRATDLARWGGRVAPGGTMLVHDAFSSIGVTLALLVVCASGEWRYRPDGQPRRVRAARAARRGRASSPPARELPWFARNVAIKVLVLAGGGAGRSGSGSSRTPHGPTEREHEQRDARDRDPVDRDPVDRVLGVVAAAVLGPDDQREDRHRDRRARARRRARAAARRSRATGRGRCRARTAARRARRTRTRTRADGHGDQRRAPAREHRAPRVAGAARRDALAPAAARPPRARRRTSEQPSSSEATTQRERVARVDQAVRGERDRHVAARRRHAPGGAEPSPTSGAPRSWPSQLARRPRV